MKKLLLGFSWFILLTLVALDTFAYGVKDVCEPTIIRLRLNEERTECLFKMEIFEYFFPKSLPQVLTGKQIGTDCLFQLDKLERPVYINLYYRLPNKKYAVHMLRMYLVEPGDNVRIIDLQNNLDAQGTQIVRFKALQFEGKGAAKYNCKYEIEKAAFGIKSSKQVIDKNGKFITGNYFDEYKAETKLILENYKKELSQRAYDILKVDLFASTEIQRLEYLTIHSSFKDTTFLSSIIRNYQLFISEEESQLPAEATYFSFNYPQYILDKFSIGKYRGVLSKSLKETAIDQVFLELKIKIKGELRDKVLTFLALNLHSTSERGDEMLNEVMSVLNTYYCIEELELFHKQNSVGKDAYDFLLPDVNGNYRKLSDFRGKVVFIDFWFNGCGGCAQYFSKVISKVEKEFKLNDSVVFISINVDADRIRWLKGLDSKLFTNVEAINLYTDGKGIDHPVIKNYRITSYPRPLLIGKDGKIFCNNIDELRKGGAKRVIELINQALRHQNFTAQSHSKTQYLVHMTNKGNCR